MALFSSLGGTSFSINDFIYERSEEHTSELQSRLHLVCRLLLEKKKGAGAGETLPRGAARGEGRDPCLEALGRRQVQLDVEPRPPERRLRPFWLLHEHDGGLGDLLPAELAQLAGAAEAVEIRVHHRTSLRFIRLNEREGGARFFF